MYLFTRQGRLDPEHLQDGLEWAVTITEKVNQITSLDVGLWSPTLSRGFGTLSWGASVASLGDLEDAESKLQVDGIYLDLAQRGASMTTGGLDDQVAQIVHQAGDVDPAVTHVAVVEAKMANGNLRRGIQAGVEIATRAQALGGCATSFLVASTGTYGACAWITSATSLRQLEQAELAVNGDPGFLQFLDEEAAGCYLPGEATQAIWRRIV